MISGSIYILLWGRVPHWADRYFGISIKVHLGRKGIPVWRVDMIVSTGATQMIGKLARYSRI